MVEPSGPTALLSNSMSDFTSSSSTVHSNEPLNEYICIVISCIRKGYESYEVRLGREKGCWWKKVGLRMRRVGTFFSGDEDGEAVWRSGPDIQAVVLCLVTQSWPAICYPKDCSPPGSSVHRDSPARILEWVAMPYTSGSSQPRDRT